MKSKDLERGSAPILNSLAPVDVDKFRKAPAFAMAGERAMIGAAVPGLGAPAGGSPAKAAVAAAAAFVAASVAAAEAARGQRKLRDSCVSRKYDYLRHALSRC